jgi:hypothetical protein
LRNKAKKSFIFIKTSGHKANSCTWSPLVARLPKRSCQDPRCLSPARPSAARLADPPGEAGLKSGSAQGIARDAQTLTNQVIHRFGAQFH